MYKVGDKFLGPGRDLHVLAQINENHAQLISYTTGKAFGVRPGHIDNPGAINDVEFNRITRWNSGSFARLVDALPVPKTEEFNDDETLLCKDEGGIRTWVGRVPRHRSDKRTGSRTARQEAIRIEDGTIS